MAVCLRRGPRSTGGTTRSRTTRLRKHHKIRRRPYLEGRHSLYLLRSPLTAGASVGAGADVDAALAGQRSSQRPPHFAVHDPCIQWVGTARRRGHRDVQAL